MSDKPDLKLVYSASPEQIKAVETKKWHGEFMEACIKALYEAEEKRIKEGHDI